MFFFLVRAINKMLHSMAPTHNNFTVRIMILLEYLDFIIKLFILTCK